MERPTGSTVEAPFDGRSFVEGETATSFHSRAGRFIVRTRGADNVEQDFEVAWTFGFAPLQQYLLDLGDNRLQALTVAWDARPEYEGGQRFYSLYPEQDLAPGDPLHWTGPLQNWNYACADCHSTNYRKGYQPASKRFVPSWAEPDVGCEACHGPGSRHVDWAGRDPDHEQPGVGLVVDLTNSRIWTISPTTHNALPQPDLVHTEVETCAPCHSRRHQIAEGRTPDRPLLDHYRPELLEAGLYHVDGQIDDEVYEYGSFTQSRMYQAGVRCSDCHDPHTLALRAEGDALCGRCHDSGIYAATQHHQHEVGERGSACIDCHMPAKLYMGVDLRRDHSLQKPRPTLAVRLGTPTACASCHRDRSTDWIGEHANTWWPLPPDQPAHHGDAFAAGRRGTAEGLALLVMIADDSSRPAIVRGTALRLLDRYGVAALAALARGARDPEPLVRLGAIYGARGLPPGARLAALAPLLDEPLRVLRIEAARTLTVVPVNQLRGQTFKLIESAREELLASEALHADRSDAWLRVGLIELERGQLDPAERALEQALEVEPRAIPPRINLADLARIRGDEAAAEMWLKEALALAPDDPDVHHALGLLEIRAGHHDEALGYLAAAASQRPDQPRYAYVYAVALWSRGRRAQARAVLAEARELHPDDPALREAQLAYQ